MRVKSRDVLEKLGYEYIYRREEAVEPEYVNVTFEDLVPEFSQLDIGKYRLYEHQLRGYNALRRGKNLILRSGTGSGKTEVWVLHGINELKNNKHYTILAIYPTLALANDQIKRINKYFSVINTTPLQLDSVKRSEYEARIGKSGLRELVNSSNIVISNPAFILHDLKKYLLNPARALLYNVYKRLNLLVIDEIDFYGPRSLALLLAMIKLLSEFTDNQLQVVVLTATLSNPDDLGKYLQEVTNREYEVVEGKPFNVENHIYIVLGKNLKSIWDKIRGDSEKILSMISDEVVKREILKALESYDYFSKNIYRVSSILSSIGYEVPSISIDYSEIIGSYLDDEYVTIVFTNSISVAEEVVRNIKHQYGENAAIASHHHLVPKKKREEIEEGARKGLVKVIVSPRTLSQGIDIGTVARIVHLGLPDDVREYFQREGRKGRRRELGFAESVIIPFSRWDRELLSRGFEVFNKWLEMGLEKTLVNPNNNYIHLFMGLAKLRSPWYKSELSVREKEVLMKIGVLTNKGVNDKLARWIYERMNFYEFAPPYGIKRYLEKEGKLIPLEPIGHCDLVEKFQPGNIDYSEEAMVTRIEAGKTTRHVKAVYEKPVREINFYHDDALSVAYEDYRLIKLEWREKPNIIRDILAGRLTSEELCVVYVPWNGFGKYRKIPDRCIWKLRSEKPRVRVVDDKVIVYYDRRQVYVPTPVAGEYRDFTYGYRYSVDPSEKSDLLRLALATLMIILRRAYGIAFETIMYDVIRIGEYKYFSLHEPEAAGIIDKIDWLNVRRVVEQYKFDELDSILLSEIDEIAYSTLISYDFDWELVRKQILRVIDYILARDKIKVLFKGVETVIPKPSPALKKIALSIIVEVLGEETEAPQILVSIALYDGDKTYSATTLYPPIPYIKPPNEILELEKIVVDKVVYEDFNLVVDELNSLLSQLKTANLRQLVMLVEGMREKVSSVSDLIKSKSIDPISLDDVFEQLGEFEIDIKRINPAFIRDVLNRVRDKSRASGREKELIEEYVVNQAKKLYIAYLILSNL